MIGTSGRRAGTRKGAGVTATLHTSPWNLGLRPKKLYTSVAMIPTVVRVPTQWSLVLTFTSVVGLVENFHLAYID